MLDYRSERILIWGKTAPELSSNYTETVCTGGVLEDGTPVRLYPIPFRYLDGEQRFRNYQWITASIARDHRDRRPESHRVLDDSIICEEVLPTSIDEWGVRGEVVFKDMDWQFPSLEKLQEEERKTGRSIGVVEPKEIKRIFVKERTDEERDEFFEKFTKLLEQNAADRQQIPMFEQFTVPELKKLPFIDSRLGVTWKCHGEECNEHNTQVLDWGLIELQRRLGVDAAKAKLEEICNLDNYALKFFMGNIKAHPTAFTIVGLWYPKRSYGLF